MATPSTPTSVASSGYGTLSRSGNKTNGTPQKKNNAFGSSLTMNREDHERERVRWQQKLDETEGRLSEAEVFNSDMTQLKAELNKRIVEMERNQKPLIEQNRRLSERNRLLQNEIKKGEQKLCHSQDDFLTLKDGYERLVKDNQSLKEKRAFPEKIEELERYRNQVLEYSKCITALRQSALEKDRRYELLVQKFKRLRKCVLPRRNGDNEDDRQSSFGGSDCSAESSISLDTITENFGESLDKDLEGNYQQLAREHDELQRALTSLKMSSMTYGDEHVLREQLLCAQTTITHQQRLIEQHTVQSDNTVDFLGTIARLQDQVIALQAKCERLERELSDSQENNELLEFQLLENNENMKHELEESLANRVGVDQFAETDTWISVDQDDDLFSQTPSLSSFDETCELKQSLLNLKKLACLDRQQRSIARQAQIYIDSLENQLHELELSSNKKMLEYEAKKVEREKVITGLMQQIQSSSTDEKGRQELEVQVETLRKSVLGLETEKQDLLKTVAEHCVQLQKHQEDAINMARQDEKQHNLLNKMADVEHQKADLTRRIGLVEKEGQALSKENTQLRNQNQALMSQAAELQARTAAMLKINEEALKEQSALSEEVNSLSKELGKIRYSLQQKDEQILTEKKLHNELKSSVDETSKQGEKRIEELVTSTNAQKEELETSKKQLAQVGEEKSVIQKENLKLHEDLNVLTTENEKLRDDIRPAIRTQLERRFEEERFRCNSALEIVHSQEAEISNLREKLAESENKLSETQRMEADLVQVQGYSEQLEMQFNTQVKIIDALKEKVVQHKKLTDLLASAAGDGVQECADIDCADFERQLECFGQSQPTNNEEINVVRRLLKRFSRRENGACDPTNTHTRVRVYNSGDSSEWLSNSSEAIGSIDGNHDLSDEGGAVLDTGVNLEPLIVLEPPQGPLEFIH